MAGARANGLLSVETADVTGGPVPQHGFVLRVVLGGKLSHACATCSWLDKCQGCLVPDDDTEIRLRDGETIAIDWHFVVYNELYDLNLATQVLTHKSCTEMTQSGQHATVPLTKCLDKFTEDEPIEGVTCPKCKEDTGLRKSFTVWRPPPILVVQLKRFQFDRTSRRKLNHQVSGSHTNCTIFWLTLCILFESVRFHTMALIWGHILRPRQGQQGARRVECLMCRPKAQRRIPQRPMLYHPRMQITRT
jgi:Ubiquitin carboxyl-terminal hydrolase